ncbi:2TM domain-containing protein [Kriegella aquimaris]|nr:2TM domain-containing protein [Kriegella aquimaris]
MEERYNNKFRRAKKRVEELKGFYIHLFVYMAVNVFILVGVYSSVSGDMDSFWDLGHFFTPIFWGIGLAFHAAKVFGFSPFFNKEWEERQIQKYIDEDKKNAEKFR